MDSFLIRREQPGLTGFARQDVPGEAYWLQNLDIDRDGIYRPRPGTKHIKTFGLGDITHLSKPAGYNHHLMVIADGGVLYDIDIESPGSPTVVDTGWPTTPVSACVAAGLTGMFWVAPKAAISGAAGQLYSWDGATLTALGSGNGNAVGMLGDILFRVVSGVGGQTAIQWATLGDIDTWPGTHQRGPLPRLGTVDRIIPITGRESALFGPSGIGRVVGDSDEPEDLSWMPIELMEVATPMHHPVLCGDRIIFLAGGPSIYELAAGAAPRRIEMPIGRDLFLAQGVSNLRAWYSPTRREFHLADLTQHIVYRYGIAEGIWKGVYTFTDETVDLIGGAAIDQGASALDATTQPWVKEFISAGPRLLQWDPSRYTDATDGSTDVAFTCAIESRSTAPDVGYEKQLTELQVDAVGEFTIKLRHRNGPGQAWTTDTLGTATFPGPPFYPSLNPVMGIGGMPSYRERVIILEAESDEDLAFRSMKPVERIVGEPLA